MSAYCLFDNLEVTDGAKLEEYKSRVLPTVQRYGGRYVVLGGRTDVVEGQWRPTYPVMLEFPSLEHAHRWYDSEEYRALKALRLRTARGSVVLVEGV